MFPLMHTLMHEYITRCARDGTARRAGGLSPDAVRHLQRSLDVYFARNPREDYEWPESAPVGRERIVRRLCHARIHHPRSERSLTGQSPTQELP